MRTKKSCKKLTPGLKILGIGVFICTMICLVLSFLTKKYSINLPFEIETLRPYIIGITIISAIIAEILYVKESLNEDIVDEKI